MEITKIASYLTTLNYKPFLDRLLIKKKFICKYNKFSILSNFTPILAFITLDAFLICYLLED